MSEEQLKAFLKAVKADAGLQEKLKVAADANAVVAIAEAAGFVVSAEDIQKAQANLPDEELEAIAGGTLLEAWNCVALNVTGTSTNNDSICWGFW